MIGSGFLVRSCPGVQSSKVTGEGRKVHDQIARNKHCTGDRAAHATGGRSNFLHTRCFSHMAAVCPFGTANERGVSTILGDWRLAAYRVDLWRVLGSAAPGL